VLQMIRIPSNSAACALIRKILLALVFAVSENDSLVLSHFQPLRIYASKVHISTVSIAAKPPNAGCLCVHMLHAQQDGR